MVSELTASDEDNRLLVFIKDLCLSLGLNYQPLTIRWVENLGRLTNLSSDQCVYLIKGSRSGTSILPAALKGRLSLEDWKPLLVSSLIFGFRPNFVRVWSRGRLVRIVMWIPILIFIGLTFLGEFSIAWSSALLGLVAILLLPRVFNQTLSRLRLMADSEAVAIVGREQFVRTLRKVDSFHIPDLDKRKMKRQHIWQRRVFPWPTITERLENLRAR